MELFYHRDIRGNFGDDLNPCFFDEICQDYQSAPFSKLIGIGTLLNDSLGEVRNSIIFGSGFGQGRPAEIDLDTSIVLGVRGPYTAESLGLDPNSAIIGDPALYLPRLSFSNRGTPLAENGTIVALHHKTAELWEFPNQERDGIYFLDPGRHKIEDYIATIRSAKMILAEGMHAAIAATAYGIPYVRVNLLGKTDPIKWKDFQQPLGIDDIPPMPINLPRPPRSRRLATRLAHRLNSKWPLHSVRAPAISDCCLDSIVLEATRIARTSNACRAEPTKLSNLIERTERSIDSLRNIVGKHER